MKKILSVFIVCLVLLSSFCLVASADKFAITESDGISTLDPDVNITFSEDFKQLYFGDTTYSSFPIEKISFSSDYYIDNLTILSEHPQKEKIDNISLFASKNGETISAGIYYKDGSSLNVDYFRDDYIEEYTRLESTDPEDLYIVFSQFRDEENIVVKTTKTLLKGEKEELKVNEIKLMDWFEVSAKSEKLNFFTQKGCFLDYSDEYYYIDFAEANIDPNNFDPWIYEGTAYKITDLALIQQIEEGLDKFYDEDYGIFFDDDFTKAVSKVFITLIFAIIPFAILVFTLICGFKAKKIYKKLFFTTAILSAAELITLAVILIIT